MTPRSDETLIHALIYGVVIVAVCLVAMPSGATASRQPALVSDQAASRLDPSGFDQAQGQ